LKICCTSIAVYMLGPAILPVPSLVAKIKAFLIIGFMEHFCDEKSHHYANITGINCIVHATSLYPC
jgi:hypothetical protein